MFILFELCPGSLFDLLYKSEEALPELRHVLKMLRHVALGIYYLHCFEPPVLHLDLKSANVLLDENGVAKVCDFGMSHVMEDAAEAVADDGRSIGSPQWSAPEKLRGERYGEKADTFSYGILLYEVMARQLPYQGMDSCQIVVGVITKLIPRPKLSAEQQAAWPAQLSALLDVCVREDPDERPTFEGVLDQFDQEWAKDTEEERKPFSAVRRSEFAEGAKSPTSPTLLHSSSSRSTKTTGTVNIDSGREHTPRASEQPLHTSGTRGRAVSEQPKASASSASLSPRSSPRDASVSVSGAESARSAASHDATRRRPSVMRALEASDEAKAYAAKAGVAWRSDESDETAMRCSFSSCSSSTADVGSPGDEALASRLKRVSASLPRCAVPEQRTPVVTESSP